MATKKEVNEVEEVITLSTGVQVVFQPMSQNEVQDLVLASFSGMNLNKMKEEDVLQHGDKILRYNTTLIQDGVHLVGGLDTAIKTLGLSKNWVKQLLRSGKVLDADLYDLDDERDQEILFLRFYGFKTEGDFQVLTEKLLSTG